MIPSIVHYIWVGDKPMPESSVNILRSNEIFLKNYDVKIWTEENIDLTAPFVRRAYEQKRWAFVSDYVRFVLLRDYGGIYLDADMELLKSIDVFLDSPAFSGLNRKGDSVYCGIIGSEPSNPIFCQLVKEYDGLPNDLWPTSPEMLTLVSKRFSSDIVIYPYTYFYPVDEGKRADTELMSQAYATHHWHESWRRFVMLRRVLRRLGIIPLFHKWQDSLNKIEI